VSFHICSNVKLVHMVYQIEFIPKVSSITQLNLIWLGNQIIRLNEGLSPSNCIGTDMFMEHMTITVVRNFWLNQFLEVFKLIMVKDIVVILFILVKVMVFVEILFILVKDWLLMVLVSMVKFLIKLVIRQVRRFIVLIIV
jgi:hypothetical protein